MTPIMCQERTWNASRRHRCGLRPEHDGDHECIGNCGYRWSNEPSPVASSPVGGEHVS